MGRCAMCPSSCMLQRRRVRLMCGGSSFALLARLHSPALRFTTCTACTMPCFGDLSMPILCFGDLYHANVVFRGRVDANCVFRGPVGVVSHCANSNVN